MLRLSAARRPVPGTEDSGSPFIPAGELSRYRAPKATIDPDQTKTWWKRALPLVKAHRATFIAALSLSMLALIIQVQIPHLLQRAIDTALVVHQTQLSGFVYWIVALAIVRWAALYFGRSFLLQTGYAIEADLRNQMYQHF